MTMIISGQFHIDLESLSHWVNRGQKVNLTVNDASYNSKSYVFGDSFDFEIRILQINEENWKYLHHVLILKNMLNDVIFMTHTFSENGKTKNRFCEIAPMCLIQPFFTPLGFGRKI